MQYTYWPFSFNNLSNVCLCSEGKLVELRAASCHFELEGQRNLLHVTLSEVST